MYVIRITSFFGQPQKFLKSANLYQSNNNAVDWARLSSIDFWLGFVRLTMPNLYKEASEKNRVDQGYLPCSVEITN